MINNITILKSLLKKGNSLHFKTPKTKIFSDLKKIALACVMTSVFVGANSDISHADAITQAIPVAKNLCANMTDIENKSLEEMISTIGAYIETGKTIEHNFGDCKLKLTPVFEKSGYGEKQSDRLRMYFVRTNERYKIITSIETPLENSSFVSVKFQKVYSGFENFFDYHIGESIAEDNYDDSQGLEISRTKREYFNINELRKIITFMGIKMNFLVVDSYGLFSDNLEFSFSKIQEKQPESNSKFNSGLNQVISIDNVSQENQQKM